MSKQEYDARVAVGRGAARHVERPWYRSEERVLERHSLHGLACLDLCAGNAEFSEILRERFAMHVTCADYAPAHLERRRALGFDIVPVDLDGPHAEAYTLYMYEGTQHGFHNDTTPRYDESAAKLAWQRTVDFFNKSLR